ncbi:hypothetical protein, partial [Aurantimonas sp. C2-5-R2]|uniref:hypothetical protein n=1 Tax=Aurantimonas sp. C2-5-R2 TaxID=3113713 RepID=UPI002F93D631
KVHCPCIEGRLTFNPASPLNEVQQTSGHPLWHDAWEFMKAIPQSPAWRYQKTTPALQRRLSAN